MDKISALTGKEFRQGMEERLKRLEADGKRPIRKILAKITSPNTANPIGEICSLKIERKLGEDEVWLPVHRELGSWKFPDIFSDSPLVPYKGGITSDSKSYLHNQKERFNYFSGLIELTFTHPNEETEFWKGHQDQAPPQFRFGSAQKSKEKLGRVSSRRPPRAMEAIFARSHLQKVSQLVDELNLPPEVWPILEHAYHAGKTSSLVENFEALSDDQINYELTEQRKKKGPRQEWKQRAWEYLEENPALTSTEIANRLEGDGLAQRLRDEKMIEVSNQAQQPRNAIKWTSFHDAIERHRKNTPRA